jgi:hypothetical protein
MIDSLTNCLSNESYHIPNYAVSSLLLQSGDEFAQLDNASGMFRLECNPAAWLPLRWKTPDGPMLIVLNWQSGSLEWDGQVAVGGYIDTIHLRRDSLTGVPLAMICLGGQPMNLTYLKQQALALELAAHRGLAAQLPKTTTTWIIQQDDPMLEIAQSALFHNTMVHLFGRLAEDDDSIVNQFALPLQLEAITAFAA